MTAIQTPFDSSQGKYNFLGSMRLINAYAEIMPHGAKSKIQVLPCPGMVSYSSVTDTPFRGGIYLEDLDAIYEVHSSGVYKVVEGGTATRLGTIPGIDRVQIARNQKVTPQVVILCDAGLYLVENETVSKIIDDSLSDVVSITGGGNYIVYAKASGRFYISAINEATSVDPLDFATAEVTSDRLRSVYRLGDGLIIFKQFNTEFWRLTEREGVDVFAFEPIGGTPMRKGLLAPNSIAECDNTIFWVGLAKEGDRSVYRLNGYQPLKISDNDVDRAIEADPSPEDIVGFAHSLEGHACYTIRGTNFTLTYDASTKLWHERNSVGQTNWRANGSISAWNKVFVGDALTGNLYYLSSDTYTEASGTMIWKVRTPFMHAFPNGGVVDALHIDFLSGQGVTSPTAQGYDPLLMLSYSDDGGNTFTNPRHIELGKQGNYRRRVTTRRLGRFGRNGRVWEMSVSDPVGRGLALMDAQVRPLRL